MRRLTFKEPDGKWGIIGMNKNNEDEKLYEVARKLFEIEEKYILNVKEFVHEVGQNAVDHGWWDGPERSFGELIALCHSELSEALEEYRKGLKPAETYYSFASKDRKECNLRSFNYKNRKPEGIPSELADVIIRIFDMCHHYDIDIEKALLEKHEFNKNRSYKHGGKVI